VKPNVVVSRGRAHVSDRHMICGSYSRMAGSRAVANEDSAHPDPFHATTRIRGWRGRWSKCDRTSVANCREEITFQFPSSAISPLFHGNDLALLLRGRPLLGRGIPGSPAAPPFPLIWEIIWCPGLSRSIRRPCFLIRVGFRRAVPFCSASEESRGRRSVWILLRRSRMFWRAAARRSVVKLCSFWFWSRFIRE
jgi:hypothetical protein